MFRIHNTVTLDLKPLEAYKRRFRNPKTPQMRPVMNQWRKRYLGFIRRRYVSHSKGAGNWTALSAATIRQRRKGKKATRNTKQSSLMSVTRQRNKKKYTMLASAGGTFSILRDTSTLFGGLDISRSDNWKFIHNGMRVGFLKAKSSRHPGLKQSLSVADIAGIHQFGKGRNPKRQIIVDPDKQTTDGMIRDLMRATK